MALLPALLVMACSDEAPSTSLDTRASLEAAAQRYEEAQIAGDAEPLQSLTADEYVPVGSDGARQSKADLVAFWSADGFARAPVTITEPVEHIWSDGATLGGAVTLSWSEGGTPINVTIRYIDIWALRDGEWRVVYGQSTRAPAPS